MTLTLVVVCPWIVEILATHSPPLLRDLCGTTCSGEASLQFDPRSEAEVTALLTARRERRRILQIERLVYPVNRASLRPVVEPAPAPGSSRGAASHGRAAGPGRLSSVSPAMERPGSAVRPSSATPLSADGVTRVASPPAVTSDHGVAVGAVSPGSVSGVDGLASPRAAATPNRDAAVGAAPAASTPLASSVPTVPSAAGTPSVPSSPRVTASAHPPLVMTTRHRGEPYSGHVKPEPLPGPASGIDTAIEKARQLLRAAIVTSLTKGRSAAFSTCGWGVARLHGALSRRALSRYVWVATVMNVQGR